MNRIWLVAKREFLTTVVRKGFLIGVFLMPVLGIGLMAVMPRIMGSRAPEVAGTVVVIDQTQAVQSTLPALLTPEAIAARRAEGRRRQTEAVAPGMGGAAATLRGPQPPRLTFVDPPAGADIEAAKRWLAATPEKPSASAPRRLALIVIASDAVARTAGQTDFGNYQLFLAPRVDEATENTLHEGLRLALVRSRLTAAGFDPQTVESAMVVARPEAIVVAAAGEQRASRGLNRTLPFIMGILLFVGVMMGGQTLMTSTIEEKSSRVVEVLLAAVSPLELMWGKLLGQLAVSLLVMAIYIGVGLFALLQFALFGLIDPLLILYLFAFFLVTYLVFGALMLAVGAAVTQMADAQALLGPIIMLLVIPYAMTPFIGQNPNSTFSVVMSFLPPVNTFAMLARMASATPPPAWQPPVTLLLAFLAAAAAVWFASKVFRIGLLLHGKPPSLATLWRWARMA
jgi:ABC-2 type transport system permease protein